MCFKPAFLTMHQNLDVKSEEENWAWGSKTKQLQDQHILFLTFFLSVTWMDEMLFKMKNALVQKRQCVCTLPPNTYLNFKHLQQINNMNYIVYVLFSFP